MTPPVFLFRQNEKIKDMSVMSSHPNLDCSLGPWDKETLTEIDFFLTLSRILYRTLQVPCSFKYLEEMEIFLTGTSKTVWNSDLIKQF